MSVDFLLLFVIVILLCCFVVVVVDDVPSAFSVSWKQQVGNFWQVHLLWWWNFVILMQLWTVAHFTCTSFTVSLTWAARICQKRYAGSCGSSCTVPLVRTCVP